jgi:hypothetical protein
MQNEGADTQTAPYSSEEGTPEDMRFPLLASPGRATPVDRPESASHTDAESLSNDITATNATEEDTLNPGPAHPTFSPITSNATANIPARGADNDTRVSTSRTNPIDQAVKIPSEIIDITSDDESMKSRSPVSSLDQEPLDDDRRISPLEREAFAPRAAAAEPNQEATEELVPAQTASSPASITGGDVPDQYADGCQDKSEDANSENGEDASSEPKRARIYSSPATSNTSGRIPALASDSNTSEEASKPDTPVQEEVSTTGNLEAGEEAVNEHSEHSREGVAGVEPVNDSNPGSMPMKDTSSPASITEGNVETQDTDGNQDRNEDEDNENNDDGGNDRKKDPDYVGSSEGREGSDGEEAVSEVESQDEEEYEDEDDHDFLNTNDEPAQDIHPDLEEFWKEYKIIREQLDDRQIGAEAGIQGKFARAPIGHYGLPF